MPVRVRIVSAAIALALAAPHLQAQRANPVIDALTRQIDSASLVAGRLQSIADRNLAIGRTASQFLFVAGVTNGFGGRGGLRDPGLFRPNVGEVVGLAAVLSATEFGRNSHGFAPWMGLATATSGASWILSSLIRRPPCSGRFGCRRGMSLAP